MTTTTVDVEPVNLDAPQALAAAAVLAPGDGAADAALTAQCDDEEPASPTETRAAFAAASARGYTVTRAVLVQLPDGDERGSTVGWAVNARAHRALVLYLLLLQVWPWLTEDQEPMPAKLWVRALQYDDSSALTWSTTTLSRAWRVLLDAGLITRNRRGLASWVEPLREDGGKNYTAPAGAKKNRYEAYFTLPDCFWREGHFATLSLPALAMLLITLRETTQAVEFYLPYDKGPAWYGISPKTVERGFLELKDRGLVHRRYQKIKAPRSETGQTTRIWYRPMGEYSTAHRKEARAKAAKARTTNQQPATTAGTSDVGA